MIKKYCLPITVSFMFCAALSAKEATHKNPNIILILADDLGYGDLSCLNKKGKIATPNIDRISRKGVTFTDAHSSAAVCTPTRYGLLTGRYNWRSRLKQGVKELTTLLTKYVDEGRSTPGKPQKNDGEYPWKQLKWMKN